MVATGRNSRPPRSCAALFGPTSVRSLTMITEVSCDVAGFGGADFAASFAYPNAVWATKRHTKHKKLKPGNLCFFVAFMLLSGQCVCYKLAKLIQEFSHDS